MTSDRPDDLDGPPDDPDEPADVASALSVLGNETRVAIVEALVAARRDRPERPGLSFSELRERAGVRDSGRFNYHLGKLQGRYVEEGGTTPHGAVEGYSLTYAGEMIAEAILAGTYHGRDRFGPVVLDEDCPLCDTPLTAEHDAGDVVVSCDEGHRMLETELPPGADVDDAADLVDLAMERALADLSMQVDGTCSRCYGPFDGSVETQEYADEELVAFVGACRRCGHYTLNSVVVCALQHPVVQAFFHDHDAVAYLSRPWRLADPEFVDGEDRGDHHHIAFTLDGGTCHVTVDEDGAVVTVETSS